MKLKDEKLLSNRAFKFNLRHSTKAHVQGKSVQELFHYFDQDGNGFVSKAGGVLRTCCRPTFNILLLLRASV